MKTIKELIEEIKHFKKNGVVQLDIQDVLNAFEKAKEYHEAQMAIQIEERLRLIEEIEELKKQNNKLKYALGDTHSNCISKADVKKAVMNGDNTSRRYILIELGIEADA